MSAIGLRLTRMRLRFEAEEAVGYAGFLGSTWRGALGHALKKVVCVTKLEECKGCLLYRSCAYPYVFSTPVEEGEGKLANLREAPHPFVLTVPFRAEPGAREVELGVTLFGRSAVYAPYVVYALRAAAERLRPLPPLELRAVEQEVTPGTGEWRRVYERGGELKLLPPAVLGSEKAPEGQVWVRAHTPLRFRYQERYVNPANFTFGGLFRNLLRRIALLMEFHEGTALAVPFREMVAAGDAVALERAQMVWVDWTRYSSRQETRMQMGGMLGVFAVDVGQATGVWSYFHLGQYTHVGKATSMGLGRYTIHRGYEEAMRAW